MRAAPALELTLQRFGVWRAALATLSAAAAASCTAWLGAGAWTLPVATAAAALSLFATRRAPQRLGWDGEGWQLATAVAPAGEPLAGTLRAMIDLDGFLLLRFEAADSRAVHWLPVQRRGHEAAWHALRCAVYSSRPAAASAPPDEFPPPPA